MENKTIKPRRHAAGRDPAKREAILIGAAQVFLDRGFDAASVNDICRAADVSKSTLYVYFDSKDDLFESLIEHERDRVFAGLSECLREERPLRDKLKDFVFILAKILCSDEVIRSQRAIIGMVERMPELGIRYYDGGAMRMRLLISQFLDSEVANGTLEIEDTTLAAYQLIELSTGGVWRQCLFSKVKYPPPAEILRKSSSSAVDLFLAGYTKR
ncbi:TetR/AcrR family transcriptional regulator [Falsihalocynthiibacter arcticus]|uniref:Transcriptional regulator n=1 Tax=Falsihalocynthiibacter arcticus TaxID=1579316 RepID=A0A126V1G3_9RHOB|nr:TetR/AcrR family transcriptional regulator [Falsihalocynthiibacter arcticus]AML52133.1 transcriptional regulator [Falsihalocynthiibacter arcticus]